MAAPGVVGGARPATCISTLVVNANTSAVSILLPAISAMALAEALFLERYATMRP